VRRFVALAEALSAAAAAGTPPPAALGDVRHAADEPQGVTAAAGAPAPLAPPPRAANERVPPLAELARDYRARADGCVTLHGRAVRVTHPISSFGMESTPVADAEREG